MRNAAAVEALFTRSSSVGKVVERLIRATKTSVDAALYRLINPRLVRALHEATQRGVRVRVVLDRVKYELTPATRELVAKFKIPCRLMSGRQGRFAKMHHKFAILDGRTALTGSYNWTLESEDQNYENLMIVRVPAEAKRFEREFEALWREAGKRRSPQARPRPSDPS